MQASGGLVIGCLASEAAPHRMHIRAALAAAMPEEDAGAAWVVEWGVRAMSLGRKKGGASYANEAHHILARYHAGVNVRDMGPGSLVAMADSRFTRFTTAEINAAKTQDNLREFDAILAHHVEEMDKQTESIRGADPACPECRGNNVRHTGSKQIRSSDEPMTEFWSCLSCHNKWRT